MLEVENVANWDNRRRFEAYRRLRMVSRLSSQTSRSNVR